MVMMYLFQEPFSHEPRPERPDVAKKYKQHKKDEGKYDMLRILQDDANYLGRGLHYRILWACEEGEENPCTWVEASLVDESAVTEWKWWSWTRPL